MAPTKDELDRAHSIIEEIVDTDSLLYSELEIESVCGWRSHDDAPTKCGKPVRKACILFSDEEYGRVNVVAYCDHHAACMTEACSSRRRKN